jgi:hypothetical protein
MHAAADSDAVKRPKLDAHVSTTSSGTGSSAASQHDGETPSGQTRVESTTTVGNWNATDGGASPQFVNTPKLSLALGGPKKHSSPPTASPTVLPGYRESIYGASPQANPWRDNARDDGLTSLQQLSRIASGNDHRSGYNSLPSDKLNLTGSTQHAHRTGQGNAPPLLTHESTTSTNMSTASSGSTISSSAYFSPRTPMEPPLERALPVPALYPQKSNGSFEHQLPPLRPPSLSPRLTLAGSQQSPNGTPQPHTSYSSLLRCHLFYELFLCTESTDVNQVSVLLWIFLRRWHLCVAILQQHRSSFRMMINPTLDIEI